MKLNVVTCGSCGKVFAHELEVETLSCPYCRFVSDICDFPDLDYPPEKNNSYIEV